jgi:hypothetical protein
VRLFLWLIIAFTLCSPALAQKPSRPARGRIVSITRSASIPELGGAPGYIIELNDPRGPFPILNSPMELYIGTNRFEGGGQKDDDPNSLEFYLTRSEFASVKTGDRVTLSYGLPDPASLRAGVPPDPPEWGFGPLNKRIVRPEKRRPLHRKAAPSSKP